MLVVEAAQRLVTQSVPLLLLDMEHLPRAVQMELIWADKMLNKEDSVVVEVVGEQVELVLAVLV
jgi:hypothetical protein